MNIDPTPTELSMVDVVTIHLDAGEVIPPAESVPCQFCVAARMAHRVTQTVSGGEVEDDGTSFDQDGRLHIHSWKQASRVFICSNGHSRAERYLYRCPACGWTVDNADRMQNDQTV